MALNPKLEFFRFSLKPKDKSFKTFKDFAISKFDLSKGSNDEDIIKEFFNYFISSLDGEYSKDKIQKKQITLIKNEDVNRYLKYQPKYKSKNNIIHGVINGGDYGRERILSNVDDANESSKMKLTDSVLQYFYFLLYLPTDHNEGCFILHSNSGSESITKIFRRFISKIFDQEGFNKIEAELFTPISFQDEFKKGSNLQSISFKKSFVDNIHNTNGISNKLDEYDIIVKVIPKNKGIPISEVMWVRKIFSGFKINRGNQTTDKIEDFDQTKFIARNPVTKSNKTFEWNKKDNEFAPVVYLEGRIDNNNLDGTPNFDELEELCNNLFNDEVLPELRPDLNVTRAEKIFENLN